MGKNLPIIAFACLGLFALDGAATAETLGTSAISDIKAYAAPNPIPRRSWGGDKIAVPGEAVRMLASDEPSADKPLECFLVDGSRVMATAAECQQQRGSPDKDKAALAECMMRDGSSMLTTGQACDHAGGTRPGSKLYPDAQAFHQAVAAYNLADFVTASRLLRPIASKGDARAQALLGALFGEGRGIPQDPAQALRWYRLAAEQGLASAETALGDLYAAGRGVPSNPAEAVKWYQKAADQDDDVAETKLGDMYLRGVGVTADLDTAVAWFRRAADHADAAAKLKLQVAQQFRAGMLRYLVRDFTGAVQDFKGALKSDPAFADAYDLSGWAYSAEADQRNAVISFARAADLRLRQQWAGSKRPFDAPMRVVIVRSSVGCEADCPEWISAEGQIVASTPNDFKRVLKEMGGRNLPVILHSPGGNVDAAMAIGRLIRASKLDVAVGKTLFDGCAPEDKNCPPPGGQFRGMLYSTNAVCASACPLILAAGKERIVGAFGIAAVHQLKTTYVKTLTTYEIQYQIVNGEKHIISKTPVSTKTSKSDVFKLTKAQETGLLQYFSETGIDPTLIGLMEETPFATVHKLDYTELKKFHLVTSPSESETLIDPGLCHGGQPAPNCVSATAGAAAPSGRTK